MNIKTWKKREGEELNKILEHMSEARITGSEINGNGLSVIYLELRNRLPEDTIQLKIAKGDYSAEVHLYEVQRPRIGIAEVELVKKEDDSTVLGFRLFVDSSNMRIDNRNDLDDQILKAMRDQIKVQCANEVKKLVGTLPTVIDSEEFMNELRGTCSVKYRARLQNGLNIPMNVNEMSENTVAFYEVLDRAKEANITFTRKPAPQMNTNEMPF